MTGACQLLRIACPQASSCIGFALLAALILLVLPAAARHLPPEPVGKYLTYAFVASAWCCAGATAAS